MAEYQFYAVLVWYFAAGRIRVPSKEKRLVRQEKRESEKDCKYEKVDGDPRRETDKRSHDKTTWNIRDVYMRRTSPERQANSNRKHILHSYRGSKTCLRNKYAKQNLNRAPRW